MSVLKREEAPEVFREAILYREWGYRLTSLGRYLSAIDYFEKASKSAEAEDLRTLIGLYRALIKCAKYFAAEKLSEKCMKIGKTARSFVELRFYVNVKRCRYQGYLFRPFIVICK